MRRLLRWALTGALLAVGGWVARLTLLERGARRRLSAPTGPWPDLPPPAPPEPWVPPLDGGACPVSHPVKAKLRSKVFHLPGMAAYARTTPDRCYLTAETAEADGFRRASR